MKDVILYTALINGRDKYKPPPAGNYDYRCFTDNADLKKEPGCIYTPWLVKAPLQNADPVRTARVFKVLPQLFFSEYKVWIWADANIHLKPGADIGSLIDKAKPIASIQNHVVSELYQEADFIIRANLDLKSIVESQMATYRQDGYPVGRVTSATGILVRRNEEAVRDFNVKWWEAISSGSRRDQLGFNYLLWKTKLPIGDLGTVHQNPWFTTVGHKGEVRPVTG